MRRKWNSSRGETLVEVLAAILIGALSVALLFTAVMASVSMDRTAKKTDKDFYEALNAAEAQETAGIFSVLPGTEVTVTGENEAGTKTTATPPVTFYGGEGVLSYKLNP